MFRLSVVLFALTSTSPLLANCPEAAYLPAGYKHGAKIDFKEIAAFLSKHGIEPGELRYLEKPGARDAENWLQGVNYTDLDSAIILTRKRADDAVGLVCFKSAATLTRFKKSAMQEQVRIAKRTGKKLAFDESTGVVDLAEDNARAVFSGRAIVFGRKDAVERFRKNLANKQVTQSAKFGNSKAQVFLSVDSATIGNKNAQDIPDFGGMRALIMDMRGIEMQVKIKGEPKFTIGLVMSRKDMALKVATLLFVYKELALQFSGAIDDRQARKALTSLLSRLKFEAKGKNAEMNLQFQKFETALLVAWLKAEIAKGKRTHADHKEALVQEQLCAALASGKSSTTDLNKLKDVNLRTSSGTYVIHCAASGGNKVLVDYLRQRGSNIQLLNSNDETAYDAAFNARQYTIADSLLAEPRERKLHLALLQLAATDKTMRISSQVDGHKVVRVKTSLAMAESDGRRTATLPELTLADGSKITFELGYDAENPLVHPAREQAQYEASFTIMTRRPEQVGTVPETTGAEEGAEAPAETAPAEPAEDPLSGPVIHGNLLSARDPEYKEPVAPATQEPSPDEAPAGEQQ